MLSLKRRPSAADVVSMFIRKQQAPVVPGAGLRCLRFSLNSPVVSIDGLPVGPSEACIAVHRRGGGLGLVLALRSVRTAQMAFFAPEASEPLADAALALEAAASFAEAMGFLFDEDVLVDARDPRAAECRWRDFLAEPELPEQPAGRVLSKFRFTRPVPPAASRGRAIWPGRAAAG